jgi:hypothetical protein
MSLTAKIAAVAQALYTKALDLSTPTDAVTLNPSIDLPSGTGSGQADLIFHDKRTLGDGANENLDLAGSLVDSFGATLAFVKVKFILFYNLSATQTLTIGGAASNQFINWVGSASDKINIPPGGFFALAAPLAGFAVTAGTGDLLKVANSAGAACDYDVLLIGTSA